ncbi:MAG: flagellar assembly protein FliH [Oleiphilaceae bacterium]|jgi:flagellar assembly protein FliH
MSDKKEERPLGELSAYERWELPTLNDPNAPLRSRSAVVNKPIKPLTAKDLEKIHQDAYIAGFEEGQTAGHEAGQKTGLNVGKKTGHQEGLQQGLVAGQVQINEQIEQLKKLMSQLIDPISDQRKQVEQSTLNVALAMARTVIHRELKLDSSSIKTALTNVYQSLPKMDQGLVLTINPADKVHLDHVLESIEHKIELKQDSSIMLGGCLLETSNQLIDYTIEKRFQKVVHEMLLNATESESDSASHETSTTIKELSDYPVDLLDKVDELAAEAAEKKTKQTNEQTELSGTQEPDTQVPNIEEQQELSEVDEEAAAQTAEKTVEQTNEQAEIPDTEVLQTVAEDAELEVIEANTSPEKDVDAELNKTDDNND